MVLERVPTTASSTEPVSTPPACEIASYHATFAISFHFISSRFTSYIPSTPCLPPLNSAPPLPGFVPSRCFDGFDPSIYCEYKLCRENCSDHGTCVKGSCRCFNGWDGEICDHEIPPDNNWSGRILRDLSRLFELCSIFPPRKWASPLHR